MLSKDEISITAAITSMPKQTPGPLQFLIIRLLSLTAFQSSTLREYIKCHLVTLLVLEDIPGLSTTDVRSGLVQVSPSSTETLPGFSVFHEPGPFVAIPCPIKATGRSRTNNPYDPAF